MHSRWVVGLSMPFLGLFSIKPVNFSLFYFKLRRTTNSIKVSIRTARLNKLVRPTTRLSFLTNNGSSDSGAPFMRFKDGCGGLDQLGFLLTLAFTACGERRQRPEFWACPLQSSFQAAEWTLAIVFRMICNTRSTAGRYKWPSATSPATT